MPVACSILQVMGSIPVRRWVRQATLAEEDKSVTRKPLGTAIRQYLEMKSLRLSAVALACLSILAAQVSRPPYPGYPGGGTIGSPFPKPRRNHRDASSEGAATAVGIPGHSGEQNRLKPSCCPWMTAAAWNSLVRKRPNTSARPEEIKPETIVNGVRAAVEARQNQQGFLFAATVRVEKGLPAQAPRRRRHPRRAVRRALRSANDRLPSWPRHRLPATQTTLGRPGSNAASPSE